MSEQPVSVRDNLGEQAKPQKWGEQIRGTLDCITLMARCNLLMSKESLGTLEIRGKDLEYVGLYLYHRFLLMILKDTILLEPISASATRWVWMHSDRQPSTWVKLIALLETCPIAKVS